jgi:hypothetical protein
MYASLSKRSTLGLRGMKEECTFWNVGVENGYLSMEE